MSWPIGRHRTTEERQSISAKLKGRVFSPETIQRLSEAAFRRFSMPGEKEKFGLARIGENNPNWKGGVIKNSDGYSKINCPDHPSTDCDGYVYIHRLVLEKKIGRYLFPDEFAHHVDFDKTNNDPDNLTPMMRGEHTQYHSRMKYLFEHLVGA